jgi:spermidine/putrescine transport system permease protein
MASVTLQAPVETTTPPQPQRRRGHGRPWRRPWGLEAFTWLYLIWSIVPIGFAVLFSFNAGKSQSSWQGFSLRWWTGTSKAFGSILHDPTLHLALYNTLILSAAVTAITVPLGVGFAIGIDRWRGRTSNGMNFTMIFSFVIPELLLAIALMFVFLQLFRAIHLGFPAETVALVVFNISWPAIIVRARLLSIGKIYEEAAADLGANRISALWHVLTPLLMPAIFASAVLTFASVVDDFVLVEQLSGPGSQTAAVYIYSQAHGGSNGPALNALATCLLIFSLLAAVVGYVAYRFLTRGERGDGTAAALTSIAGM